MYVGGTALKWNIAESCAGSPYRVGRADDDNGYVVGVEVAHLCHVFMYGYGIYGCQYFFDACCGFVQPRGALFGGVAVPKGDGGCHDCPVIEAAQGVCGAFESPVVNVKFAIEAAGPYNVAQGNVQVGFDANAAPVFGDEFGNIDANAGNDVDVEFKTLSIFEFSPAIAVCVAVSGFGEQVAGFVGIEFGIFAIGRF